MQNTTMSNNTRDISRWTHAPPESPVPTSVNHKFTVYSPGLFVDRDHLDIVRRLADKNLDHVLDKVWACLPVIDLCRAMQVSSRWNQSVNASSGALARWREAKLQLSPENPKKKEAAQERLLQRTLRRSPRKALGNVSNLLADDSGAVFEASLHQPLETSRTTRLRSGGSSTIISQQVRPQALFIRLIIFLLSAVSLPWARGGDPECKLLCCDDSLSFHE